MAGKSAFQWPRRRLAGAFAGISLVIVAVLGYDLEESRLEAIKNARAVSDNISRLLSERLDGSIREVDFVLRDLVDRVSAMPNAFGGQASPALDRLVAAKRATLPQASSLASSIHGASPSPPIRLASATGPRNPTSRPSPPTDRSMRRPWPLSGAGRRRARLRP
jgi:hypothetical protein